MEGSLPVLTPSGDVTEMEKEAEIIPENKELPADGRRKACLMGLNKVLPKKKVEQLLRKHSIPFLKLSKPYNKPFAHIFFQVFLSMNNRS
jgi:hypothetical protein